MEARLVAARCWVAIGVVIVTASAALSAGHKTANFVVNAPSAELAREIGETAEVWRKKLAVEWIGQEMPAWSQPCPINARVSPRLGAGGATTFVFDRGQVFGWEMNIQGSRERVLDSVLPHEITHTIFACYFRQPLPRWADEGACTTVEHPSEIATQERLLIDFLHNGKGIAFDKMFAMKEYPPDVLPLYAQGYSLTRFLLMKRGKETFLTFLADGMQDEDWTRAVEQHYGYGKLYDLQIAWLDWVKQGRPALAPDGAPAATLASATRPAPPVSAVVQASANEPVHESAYVRAARTARPLHQPATPVYDASSASAASAWRR